MYMKLLHLTDEDFDKEVSEFEGVALVDFWAPWCGPCQMLGPIIEELVDDFDEGVKICKVNVDEQGGLAQKYEIMSIPTVYIFKDGDIVEQIVGAQAKTTYKEAIQKYI